ncbi:hypothetical protein EYS14_19450 [Alteromonadaceae bacterium M269]|nr:hypothetical protein EYS14_19450 [Alteromonadaceae bacterium M269]
MSTVNDQITDSINQINEMLTGIAPMQSMSMLDVAATETLGMSMFNAVTAQQNAQTSASAAATASCAKMLNQIAPPPEKPGPKVDVNAVKKIVNDLLEETHTKK